MSASRGLKPCACRAAADQRRGRAGSPSPASVTGCGTSRKPLRLSPTRGRKFSPPISSRSFALDLAAWGAAPEKLAFLDPPPRAAMTEAKTLLGELNAIDADGRITDEGTTLRRLPLPPRLARMVVDAAAEGEAGLAAEITVLIGERGLGSDDVDLPRAGLDALHRDRSPRSRDARAMAKRWSEIASPGSQQDLTERSVGALLALAYPERVAKNRGGAAGAFLLVNGRGANVDQASALAREPFLAVTEMTGTAAQSRILLAAPITLEEIEAREIEARDNVTFDAASASLRGRRSRRLGAIALSERPIPVTGSDENAQKLADGIANSASRGCPGPRR